MSPASLRRTSRYVYTLKLVLRFVCRNCWAINPCSVCEVKPAAVYRPAVRWLAFLVRSPVRDGLADYESTEYLVTSNLILVICFCSQKVTVIVEPGVEISRAGTMEPNCMCTIHSINVFSPENNRVFGPLIRDFISESLSLPAKRWVSSTATVHHEFNWNLTGIQIFFLWSNPNLLRQTGCCCCTW